MRPLHALMTLAMGLVFTGAANAYIPPQAAPASHELEQSAEALHEYMHDNYDGFASTSASHEFEEAAVALHDMLHEWEEGNATEAQVADARDAANDAMYEFVGAALSEWRSLRGDRALMQLLVDAIQDWLVINFLLQLV